MRYDYTCQQCKTMETRDVPVEERDRQACETCYRKLKRRPSAPNFVIKGFNASNGYSK